MSSARPIRPSRATDLWAATTSSMPGRFVAASRTPNAGSTGAARPEDRLVRLVLDRADQSEPLGAGAAPPQRRLPPAGVVGRARRRDGRRPGPAPSPGDTSTDSAPIIRIHAIPAHIPDRKVAIVFALSGVFSSEFERLYGVLSSASF